MLWRRLFTPEVLSYGPQRLGRFGIVANIVSIVYLCFYVLFDAFPVILACHSDLFSEQSKSSTWFMGMERSQDIQRNSHRKFYLGRIEEIKHTRLLVTLSDVFRCLCGYLIIHFFLTVFRGM
jgi:hypothetical protein